MIITVEKNLYYIKQYLDQVGKYEVYYKEDYTGPIHAYIYNGDELTNEFQIMQNGLIELAHTQHIDIKHGVLMINAQNKTPREVEKILSERIYQDIF